MKRYLLQLKENREMATAIFGVFAFSFILITTLNLTWAFLAMIIFIHLAIFQKSFHLGWIFSIITISIFPTIYIADNLITLEDLMAVLLAIIGIVSIVFDKRKMRIFPLFYYWAILVILGGVSYFFGKGVDFDKVINGVTFYQFIMTFIVYSAIIIAFQYFFQTLRRLEKFFLVLVVIGLVQATFTLLAVIFDWRFTNGIGLTSEIFGNVFAGSVSKEMIGQATGFLGHNLFLQLGDNALATIFLVTIPITLGMWLIQKNNLSTLSFQWLETKNNELNKIVDSVLKKDNQINNKIVDLKVTEKMCVLKQRIFLFFALVQVAALLFTFSYTSLIILGAGILVVGILMREERLIAIVLGLLFILIVILPGFEPALMIKSKKHILSFWNNITNVEGIEWLWTGINIRGKELYNSYFIIFNRLGLIGLAVFLGGLGQYFKEIREAYLKSDGFERVWLIIILAIFVEFILSGFFNNIFFVGPAALLFWLLYGALQNLKYKPVEFRLTETRIK